MKLSKKIKGNMLEMDIKDAEAWYMNTLRRLMMNEVPIMAIEMVEISRNDCILYDEIISHRLGLVPLTTDLSGYSLATDEEIESREYLAKSSCKITLDAKGPGVVLAKDLKSSDPKVKPVYPDMPIAKLLEGQEIKLVATAVMGLGRWHAKWSPGHAHYRRAALDDTVKDDQAPEHNTEFTFNLESWGQLKPDQVVTAAVERHNTQLKEFDTLLTQVKE